MNKCEGCGEDQGKHDSIERHECVDLIEARLLEEKGDLSAALAKWKTYAKEVRGRRSMWKGTANSRQDEIFELEKVLGEAHAALIKKSIVYKTIDGLEYMRIPDTFTISVKNDMACGRHEQSCATAWFRKGVEAEILSGEVPKDFMRCPACNGTRLGKNEGVDWGETYCRDCDETFHDLGWGWLRHLFPDEDVYGRLRSNHPRNPIEEFMRRTCLHESCSFRNKEGGLADAKDPNFMLAVAHCDECSAQRAVTIADRFLEDGDATEEDALKAGAAKVAQSVDEQTQDIPLYSFSDGSRLWKNVWKNGNEEGWYYSGRWIPQAER